MNQPSSPPIPKSKPKPPPPKVYTPEEMEAFRQKTQAWLDKLPKNERGETEKELIFEAIEKNCPGAVKDGVVTPCPKKVKNRNCVEPNNATKGKFSDEAGAEINKAQGTKVDWSKLGEFEGGQHLNGYVPWWPKLSKNNEGIITPDLKRVKTADGGTRLRGANASGVTIATGVDLGQQSQAAFEERLKKLGAKPELLKKLEPYYGKKGPDACKELRDKPLSLTKEEAELLDKDSQSYHLKQAQNNYSKAAKKVKDARPFSELTSEEQTVLLSRQYQSGNVPASLAQAIAGGDQDATLKALAGHREQAYLKQAYGK